ncbi:hypothetical protein [uncultured Selenomonas sp.]|uniref:hypothetical protein n=1 Tax=uncultured Selenomonas sp. TaxID=159275 RepID=UPI0028F15E6B|nr:hypothetical protein [uncultured Selenomonas sp.]
MIEGMKAHRRMAMYVALGLSAGGTALFHGGTAYAAETHDYTETATSINGLEGTEKTGFMSDNNIVLGTEGGPANRPFSNNGIFSGGGKENATADVSNNTITIHGLHTSNGGGYSMIYGGVSGTGALTGNKVIFNHGTSADALVGGYTGATDKDVRGNSVTVADGTIKDDIIGGWAGSASSTGTLEGNTVTITGGTLGSYSDGIVYGARTSGNGVLTNNHVSFANASSRKALYGAATDDTNSAATLRGNGVTVTSGTINSSVEGGRSVGTGDVTGNTVSISGGSALSLIGGYASRTGNATGNVVTVTGGTVTGGITGGYAAGTGRTTGNTVNLGDATHTDLAGAVLSGSDVSGGSKAADVTDNTLNVAAKNIHVKSLNNFDTYNFKLNNAFANGDTMLSVTDAGAFSGTGVDWTKINADLSGISADYINNIHGVHRVTLQKSVGPDDLHFTNYAARNYAATDTHESALVTDTDEATAKSVVWVVNRFKGGRVTYDGTSASDSGAVYGGISYDGHTTTDNVLTVKGVHGADDPKYAYGGRNEGATGDVTRNTVTIDMANAADLVEEVYGGMASVEDNTGAVDHNTANMKNGTTRLLYGGYTFGKGAVTNNEVHFEGGASTGYVMGGYLDNTASTAEMTGNKVVFTNGTAAEIVGADSKGEGKLSGNTVTFGGAGSVAEILRGALAENQAAVEGNAVTMTGGSAERVYGGTTYATNPAGDLVAGTGNALNNTVTIEGGAVTKEIMGGIGYHADGNVVTIAGGTIGTTAQAANVYGGWAAGPGSSTTGNTVNLGAADGTYTADLTNANIHGDNSSDDSVNNNMLNVYGKDVTVKSVDNFDKYNFKLKDNISGGDTMLTLANGGFGRDIDWNNVAVDLTGQTGNPNGTITLLRTNTANALKFKNYDVRDLVNDPNADYEAILRTDTDKVAGQSTHEASAVTLSTGRFRKSNWTYDGTNPVTNGEVAGGVSRRDGHTAEGNTLTITSVAPTGLNAAYGGEAKSASDVRNNHVIVEGTGSGTIANVFGGATGKADGAAEDNHVRITGGTVTNAMGGSVSGANASATGNEVTVEGGTVANVIGAGGAGGTGNIANNFVTIKGGTVTGQIVGGYTRALTSRSNGNTVSLGGGTLTGTEVWGTSYVNASNQAAVLGSSDAQIAGNTLNVAAKNLEVKKVRNFEKYTFTPTDAVQNGDTMLTLSAAGGFGELSSDGSTVKVKWSNVTADPSALLTGGAGLQGKNSITLLKTADGAADLHFDGYAATAKADGIYETILRTDGDASDTSAVLLDVNRYNDSHVTTDQDADSDLYGGYSASDHTDAGQTIGHTTSGNTLSVTRIASGKNINAYGGYTGGTAGGAENNKLTVNVTAAGAGTINNAYGGYTKGAGAVKGNQLTFSQGATLGDLIGGYADSAAHAAEVTGNTVTVTGGSVGGVVYGAKSRGTGRVSGNGVLVDSAAATADTLTGGYGASAERNRVELKDGTAHTVYGGDATTGDAVWNNVTITGGTVTDNIYGGQSLSGAANDNTVDIGAVHIQNGAANKTVVGGYASAVTDRNTIHLRGTEIDGIVLGGAIPDPASPLGMKANPNGKGNTLAIHAAGTKIADFAGVQNLRFYVPEERTAADTTPMLTLTANADKDIRGLSIGVGIAGEHSVLAKGDTISLLKIAAGHTLTTDADLRNDVTGMQGVSMRYRFGLEKQGNDELVATVRDTELNPQTKSLVETRVAAAALINGGADLLAEGGMNAAVHAASADKLRSALGVKNGDFALWAAQSGSALRLNSGSHIDAKGWNLNLGFARQKTAAHNTLTYGPFIEYGRGSYDSYLDDGTHGDGTVSYVGAGVMAKAKTSGGSYVEGSVRVGRAKSDDMSNIAGQRTGYDMSSTYYGAHIGVGQEKQTAGGTLDTYAKYFYTHQSGGSERLTTGETYDFDDVDSSRLRIGTRWTKKTLAGEFYTGLAYEYEFGSDARASYAGYGTPTPTLKGSTGLFELGYRFVRPDSNVSYGVNLTGMMGKRRGITGSMQVNWAL